MQANEAWLFASRAPAPSIFEYHHSPKNAVGSSFSLKFQSDPYLTDYIRFCVFKIKPNQKKLHKNLAVGAKSSDASPRVVLSVTHFPSTQSSLIARIQGTKPSKSLPEKQVGRR